MSTPPIAATPTQPTTQPATLRPLARGTLGRRLVVRVAALVAIVAIGLSAVVALAAYNIQVGQVDARLDRAISRQGGPGPGGPSSGGPTPSGQEIGTIFFTQTSVLTSGVILVDRASNDGVRYTSLSADAQQQLAALALGTGARSTVHLTGYGVYRVTAASGGSTRVIVGLPLSQVSSAMTSLVVFEALLTGAVIVVAVLAARSVVVHSLAPLNRLAATATAVSNLPLNSGEVEGIVRVNAADTDPVSEVGRVGLAFNHMLDNVEGALASRHASEVKLRQFVADASHELRNPLAAIRGYAELTRRERDQMSSAMAHAMGRIESESDRMSSLVEDLLLLARLDSGPALDLRPTDLTEIVLNATSDARVAGPDHRWSLALPNEPVFALGDRYRLHQVLANLLANARTHTPAGTRVETAVTVADGMAVITVTDDGPGVPPELQATVFERFTRAEVSRVRIQGGSSTGLGLAIVAAVVAAHHGTASVDSRPGRTVFAVGIPTATPDPDQSSR
ncbi:MAG: HAMP domain-containing sensor histidine kinase [Micropruina sp.]|uniref:sensor histidine kinase n=1 Tax=Micropruina sp. TaxID=2737536 RepID=UPI0039E69DCC